MLESQGKSGRLTIVVPSPIFLGADVFQAGFKYVAAGLNLGVSIPAKQCQGKTEDEYAS